MLLIKVTTILIFSFLINNITNGQVQSNTEYDYFITYYEYTNDTYYDMTNSTYIFESNSTELWKNWTLPLGCECSSDIESGVNVNSDLDQNTIIRLMNTKVSDIIKKISILLNNGFGIENNIAEHIDNMPDFNIDMLFGRLTIDDILVQLNVSEVIYEVFINI